MQNKIIVLSCPILLALTLLTSCASEKNNPISINEKYVNQQILLRAPNYANTFRTRDSHTLELKYNSDNEIVFPNNYNLRIFENTSTGWVEIKEKPTERIPPGDIVLSPTKELPAVQIVILFPDLPSLEREYSLRIYVIGQMEVHGETEQVIACTQIVLYP